MIALHTGSKTGRMCPVCENSSVFDTVIYKWLLFYSHTETNCHIPECIYKWKTYDRKLLVEKYRIAL